MPSVVYDGDRYVQRTFAVKCLKCAETLQSTHQHDFVTCKCGALSIDGGLLGGRILGNSKDFRDASVWTTEGPEPKKTLPADYWDKLRAAQSAARSAVL